MEERYVGNAKIFEEAEKQKLLKNYLAGHPYQDVTRPFYDASKGYDPIDRMQFIDIHTWLNGDLLLNADRTTMAHSLELRTPFLDKEVFKVARTLLLISELQMEQQNIFYVKQLKALCRIMFYTVKN